MYNAVQSEVCSECKRETETQDHVMFCRAENRQVIRLELITQLKEICKKNKVPEEMTTAFMGGVNAWITKTKIPNIRTLVPNASSQLKRTYREQTSIGWDQIAKGRIATSWSQFIYHEIEKENNRDEKYSSAETWGVSIIKETWKHILLLWTARNNTEHGTTPQEKTDKRKDKLVKEMEKVKQSRKVGNERDKNYIDTPIEELTSMTISQITAWIRNSKLLQAMDTKKRNEECRMMNIQRYLIQTGHRDVQSRQHIPIREPGDGYISL